MGFDTEKEAADLVRPAGLVVPMGEAEMAAQKRASPGDERVSRSTLSKAAVWKAQTRQNASQLQTSPRETKKTIEEEISPAI